MDWCSIKFIHIYCHHNCTINDYNCTNHWANYCLYLYGLDTWPTFLLSKRNPKCMNYKLPSIHFFTCPFCFRHLDMFFLISQRIYEQVLQTAVQVLWSLGSLHCFRWTSLVSKEKLQTDLDSMLHGKMIRMEEVTWPSKAQRDGKGAQCVREEGAGVTLKSPGMAAS